MKTSNAAICFASCPALALLIPLLAPLTVEAAGGIRTDGTVGNRVSQRLSGTSVDIPQDLGSTVGKNLFHSFSDFNVNTGQTVTFTGDSTLQNVISRVTGKSRSDIDGTLRSTVGRADLYLINPNGVTFGPTATIDVPASFHVSTADDLKLKDGTRFSASDPGASRLSAARPESFGFLGKSTTTNSLIAVNGTSASFATGGSFDAVGGSVRVQKATIATDSGTIRLAAVRGQNDVPVADGTNASHFSVPASQLRSTNAGAIEVTDSQLLATGSGSGVAIQGGNVGLTNTQVNFINVSNSRSRKSDGVRVHAEQLSLKSTTILNGSSTGGGDIDIQTSQNVTGVKTVIGAIATGSGAGGKVSVRTGGDLNLKASTLSTITDASGNAGKLDVSVGKQLSMDGQPGSSQIASSASQGSTGNVGAVKINVEGDMTARSSSFIGGVNQGTGRSGDVDINVNGNMRLGRGLASIRPGAAVENTADGGDIRLTVGGDLSLVAGGNIQTTSLNAGKSGNSDITVGGDLTIDNKQTRDSSTGISAATFSPTGGGAGKVQIKVSGDAQIVGGGSISSDTRSAHDAQAIIMQVGGNLLLANRGVTVDNQGIYRPSLISSSAAAGSTGNAGNVDLNVTGNVTIDEGGRIRSATEGTGSGGTVNLTVGGGLSIDNHGRYRISTGIDTIAVNKDSGPAGSISINVAGNADLRRGASIRSDTLSDSDAGSILVKVTGDLTLDKFGGRVQADGSYFPTRITSRTNAGSTGNGGKVTVNVGRNLSINEGALILTDSFGTGQAGTIAATIGGNLDIDDAGSAFVDAGILSQAFGSGKAGTVSVSVSRDLGLLNGGTISAATFSAGDAGSVDVRAGNNINIDGFNVGSQFTGISTQATPVSTGRSGAVSVIAGNALSIVNRGGISVAQLNRGQSQTAAPVQALTVQARSITLQDSRIETNSTGNAPAGAIVIRFADVLNIDPSVITTTANNGNGGRITIEGGRLVRLQGSSITTSVSGSRGNGGNITIDADALVLDTGLVQANTNAAGASGGDINLLDTRLIPSGNSFLSGGTQPRAWSSDQTGLNIIQAAAQAGINGNITFVPPQLNLSGVLANLGSPQFDTRAVTETSCKLDTGSSLIRPGAGGMPTRHGKTLVF